MQLQRQYIRPPHPISSVGRHAVRPILGRSFSHREIANTGFCLVRDREFTKRSAPASIRDRAALAITANQRGFHTMRTERNNTHGIVLAAACCLAVGLASGAAAQGVSVSTAQITAMKSEYRRPAPRPIENKALVDLGRHLFWDPRISASGNSACVGCHFPYL